VIFPRSPVTLFQFQPPLPRLTFTPMALPGIQVLPVHVPSADMAEAAEEEFSTVWYRVGIGKLAGVVMVDEKVGRQRVRWPYRGRST
jgi:hypothetical protein